MGILKQKRSSDRRIQEWEQFLRAHGFPEKKIPATAEKLNQLPDDLKAAALQWDKTGTLPDIEAEGFSARQLNEIFGLNEIASILMLGWLRRSPQEARYALSRPISKIVLDQDTISALQRAGEEDTDEDSEA